MCSSKKICFSRKYIEKLMMCVLLCCFFWMHRASTSKMEEIDDNQPIVQQHVQFFSPASYNLPHFKYKHLPQTEVRNAWNMWIRWFDNVMAAANVLDEASKKVQLLAMGGMELQCAYYGLPGADEEANEEDDCFPYQSAKAKLTQHFSPKHHDSFERFLFWSMAPQEDEPIEKFASRVQMKAGKLVLERLLLKFVILLLSTR